MNYVSGTVLKDLGKVPCIYFGDRTQKPVNPWFTGFSSFLNEYSLHASKIKCGSAASCVRMRHSLFACEKAAGARIGQQPRILSGIILQAT